MDCPVFGAGGVLADQFAFNPLAGRVLGQAGHTRDAEEPRFYVLRDYQLRAAAGQTMKAVFKSPHAAAYFNLPPPGSAETAMYVGQFGQHCMNRFDGLLPADGER